MPIGVILVTCHLKSPQSKNSSNLNHRWYKNNLFNINKHIII